MTLEEIFENITTSEIDRYIAERKEENLTMEFQTVNYPTAITETKNFDLEALSKALSGFANSQGGIIVWGIFVKMDAKAKGSADRKNPIKDLNGFMEFLEESTEMMVSPRITGVKHKIIEESSNFGYAATYIPASTKAPHMANFQKLYYKRSGARFYKCEHYDVTDMIGRALKPELEMIVFGAAPSGSGSSY
ncbi:MAG: ATP-binding protein, partial [Flavobacteriales bacterium]|nr:ATP-binding protein [Flavobacteriales bacterium]